MKTLRFNFCHPLKGRALLINLSASAQESHLIDFDTDSHHMLEIPVDACGLGKWKIILNWEFEDHTFTHQNEFDILESSL